MGRELKRVPLDFKWPKDMLWKGYVNPYQSVQCKACGGRGYSEKALKYLDEWYGLCGGSWIQHPCRPNRKYNPYAHKYNLTQLEVDALIDSGRIPELCNCGFPVTPEHIRNLLLQNSSILDGFEYICMKATAQAEGWEYVCEYCHGEGEFWFSEEIRKAAEEWQREDPPMGDGYQLWSTTCEGCPKTPVFETKEELAKWCVDHETIFGFTMLTYEQWMERFENWDMSYEIFPGVMV